MAPPSVRPTERASPRAARVSQLAREASLEVNDLELRDLDAARELLAPGRRVYVSHLPRQSWSRTFEMCALVARRGFEPVPHLPVRLVRDRTEWGTLLRQARDAGVREQLLISGDYAGAQGPFSSVLDAIETGEIERQGFTRVSFAGHPEGHPAVSSTVILEAQIEKWRRATAMGVEVSFVTQFFFAADAFGRWARELRDAGVRASLVAGIAGPVGLGKLIRLARRCGVGESLRALTARPASTLKLLADHDPAALLRDLVALAPGSAPDGIHVFSFGGLMRTAEWLDHRGRGH
jgi:methylenetetrahydrofolate reductase (NADPH)